MRLVLSNSTMTRDERCMLMVYPFRLVGDVRNLSEEFVTPQSHMKQNFQI